MTKPKSSFFDLGGKRALVIGAEHSHGAAIARAYAEAGADVALAALTADEAVVRSRAVQRDVEAMGRKSSTYVMDVMLGKNVEVTMRQIVKEMGGVDIVASCPDLFLAKPIERTSDTELARVMQANFTSQYFIVRHAAEEFRRLKQPGRIVLTTSVLGERGLPNTTAYAAAAGAVINLVRSAAVEVAPDGIQVNGIALGWMEWMTDRLLPNDEEAQRAVRFTALRRQGRADEVGPLAVYLSSERATRYITGQIFPVDGGLLQHL
ncbi:MAG: SDR family oxidoreductase [Dehalococcoidia bacterium]|nr:SDR family oxidoreductase [Dehalococcoidia bacterium]